MSVIAQVTLAPADWDAFVSSQRMGHFMQSYGWGQLQAKSGWRPYYLAFTRDGAVIGAALLLSRGVPGLASVVFSAPRGPVFSDSCDGATAVEISEHIARFVQRAGGAFCRTDAYVEEGTRDAATFLAPPYTPLKRTWTYWNAPKYVFWLELEASEDDLLTRADKNCRNEIRSGYKKGVEFTTGTLDEIGDFYRLLVSMSATKGIAHHPETYYRNLMECIDQSGEVCLLFGRHDGRAISTGMSIRYGRRAWLMYAASDRAFSRLRATRTTQWEMIRWALARGCTRYDFRGTATGDPPNPADPGYGVYEFKRSFGPRFVRTQGYSDLVTRPLLYRAFRLAEEEALPRAYKAKVFVDRLLAARRAGGGAPTAGAVDTPSAAVSSAGTVTATDGTV